MAIWVGKQKMSCRSCIKGHRSSTCNHFGGPLWAVRPAGRPNKACIHGPSDLCLCAHYFPLTWLKAAVPRKQKCSCQGSGSGRSKCQCGPGKSTSAAAAVASPEDETQPIFYQDLVARGLQVTTEPADLEASAPAPSSCCSAPAPVQAPKPAAGSCCSGGAEPVAPAPRPALIRAPSSSSCCGGGSPARSGIATPTNGDIKTEPITSAPFTPIQQFQPLSDFPVMKFRPVSAHGHTHSHANGATSAPAEHVCNCGPSCNCVLCIEHPYNNATMNHIADEFGQMMSNPSGPAAGQFSPPSGNGTPGPDISWQGWNGMMPPGFQTDASYMQGQGSPLQSNSPPAMASDMDIILNPADFQMFNFAWPAPDGDDMEHQQQLHQQQPFEDLSGSMPDMMDLNGFCGGANEVCPCGDDCACIGCQIHKPTHAHVMGHGNGVAYGWS